MIRFQKHSFLHSWRKLLRYSLDKQIQKESDKEMKEFNNYNKFKISMYLIPDGEGFGKVIHITKI